MGLTRADVGLTQDDLERLQTLTELVAVPGHEGPVAEVVRRALEGAVDSLRVDALGNLIARTGTGDGPRVMIAAHMDEVEFIVTHIDDSGGLRIEKVGGLDTRYLPGAPVWVGPQRIPGVIGIKPIHLSSEEERSRYPRIQSMRIDLGYVNREDVESRVELGDTGTFATRSARVGDRLWGKALDNRVGVATLVRLLLDPPSGIELIGAFTVQEEIGLRGARVAAQAEAPDLAFVLDCTRADDMPGLDGAEPPRFNARFDGGPAVYVADGRTVSHPRLVRLLEETASEIDLPTQRRRPGAGGTDAGAIHISGRGVPTVSLSVPVRHMHGAVSQVRLEAWEQSYLLIEAALRRLPEAGDEFPQP